jgi:pentachlorophenol monooxygenase/3-(3-hydroxy-phenyl)propionate hydroxylase
VLALADLDPDSSIRSMLSARPGEAWLIRPDAHIAAVFSDPAPATVTAAIHRCLAYGQS